MTTAQSPFSGGGTTTGNLPNPATPGDLASILNARLKHKYLVDPMGSKIEMSFDFATTTVTIKAGDSVYTYPFIKA